MLPIEWYTDQLGIKENASRELVVKINRLSQLRLWVGILLLTAVYLLFSNGAAYYWTGAAVVTALFLYLVKVHGKRRQEHELVLLHIAVLKGELQALEGNYASFSNGVEHINVAHPYSYDLDIFGKGSIYQMLCRTVTIDGAKKLAAILQSPYAGKQVIEERQNAVKELSDRPEFLQGYRVTGLSFAEQNNDREKILSWMNMEDRFITKKYLFAASVIIPILSVVFIALSIWRQTFDAGLTLVLVCNWSILLIHAKAIKETHLLVGRSAGLIDKYEALVWAIASSDKFQNGELKNIQANAVTSIASITQFKKLVHLFDSRQNGMVGPLMNSFFLFDIYCVLKLESWRKANREALLQAFNDVSELDCFISFGVYAFNNPVHVYPAIKDGQVNITGKNIKHPLIHKNAAVGNDVSLGRDERFYLLTGANMTGKSTFIRTVGINLLLAYTGMPLPVDEFTVPLIKVFTAIRISDSVQDDVSYFKAELNRIKTIMHEVEHSETPYMILLDEPLRGTNSADKQAGTRSVVEKLVSLNAIGIVATHDAGLCDMEDKYPAQISNYHFESSVQEGELRFDFKLKRGSSTSNNATILMKQMGII